MWKNWLTPFKSFSGVAVGACAVVDCAIGVCSLVVVFSELVFSGMVFSGRVRELARVKAALTKRDWEERSPGRPIAPMPRLYSVSGRFGANLFSGEAAERCM